MFCRLEFWVRTEVIRLGYDRRLQSVLSVVIKDHLIGGIPFEKTAVQKILDDWLTAGVHIFVAVVSVVPDVRVMTLVRWPLLDESVLWL